MSVSPSWKGQHITQVALPLKLKILKIRKVKIIMTAYEIILLTVAAIAGAAIGASLLILKRTLQRVLQKSKFRQLEIAPVAQEFPFGEAIQYVDGLPQAAPNIREPFIEGQKLAKKYRYREAIKLYEACFQPETSANERAALHILIGNCFLELSELEEAEGHYKEAERAAREADDNEGLATALGNMGIIYQTRGEMDKALDYHQQALKLEKEIGRKEGQANQMGNIGNIYLVKGELDKALELYEQALKMHKEIGRKEGEASDLGNIGLIYRHKGEMDKALDYHQQALKLEKEIGRKEGQANQMGNIGNIYLVKGELDKALELYEQVLKTEREIGRRWGEANALGNMGLLYHDKGQPDKALDYSQQALKIFVEMGAKIEIERTKRNIEDIVENMEKSRGQDSGTV